MAEYQHKPGSFSLFKNDKQGNDNWPDYKGVGIDLEGNHIEVAAWLKKGAKGTFMSCAFKINRQERPQQRNIPDDDLPPF